MLDEIREVLTSEVNTILEKPVTIEIDIVSPGLWQRLMFKMGFPRKRTFELRPLVLGNLARISKRLLTVNMTLFDESENILIANYEAMGKHSVTLAEVVAIGITNSRDEPNKKLVQFILDNFTAQELLAVVGQVIKMMDIGNFMNTIISAKGMSLLNPGGTIASGAPSAA